MSRTNLHLSTPEVLPLLQPGMARPAEPVDVERLGVVLVMPFGLSDLTAALAAQGAANLAGVDGVLEHLSSLLTSRMGFPMACLAFLPVPPLRRQRTRTPAVP